MAIRRVKRLVRRQYQFLSGAFVERFRNPVVYNGIMLDVNCGAIDTKHKARFFPYYTLNEHSIREEVLIDRHLPTDRPVIELGGGIGYISAYVDARIGDVPQIVLEPNPKNFDCNRRTRQLNDADYTLIEGAYAPHDETVSLSLHSKFSSGSTAQSMSDRRIQVSGYSLSSLVSEYDLDEFALICDIEGGEFSLIDEELELLAERVPLAIIEFHEFDEFSENTYVERIESAGFDVIDEMGGTYAFETTSRA